MFNLLVANSGWHPPSGRVDKTRFLTQTDESTKQYLQRNGQVDFQTLCNIKTVFMPEVGSMVVPAEARIGQITAIRDVGKEYEFDFLIDPTIAAIPGRSNGRAFADFWSSRVRIKQYTLVSQTTRYFRAIVSL